MQQERHDACHCHPGDAERQASEASHLSKCMILSSISGIAYQWKAATRSLATPAGLGLARGPVAWNPSRRTSSESCACRRWGGQPVSVTIALDGLGCAQWCLQSPVLLQEVLSSADTSSCPSHQTGLLLFMNPLQLNCREWPAGGVAAQRGIPLQRRWTCCRVRAQSGGQETAWPSASQAGNAAAAVAAAAVAQGHGPPGT